MLSKTNYLNLQRPILVCISCKFSKEAQTKPSHTNFEVENDSQNQETRIVRQKYSPKQVTKEDMKWRKAWHEKEGAQLSFLRSFYKEDSGTSLVKRLKPGIEFTPSGIKKWIKETRDEANVILHSYVPERNAMLGHELAAAHFIVSRGGAIKFAGEDKWIKADERRNYSLPKFYDGEKFLEGIDCQDMDIVYESLENFRNLQEVKWLSLNGCQYIDDWCLDSIGNIFSDTVVYLDLRNCPSITARGLGALAKMNKLKILYLDDFLKNTTFELTCLLLQELNFALDIKSDPVTFEIE